MTDAALLCPPFFTLPGAAKQRRDSRSSPGRLSGQKASHVLRSAGSLAMPSSASWLLRLSGQGWLILLLLRRAAARVTPALSCCKGIPVAVPASYPGQKASSVICSSVSPELAVQTQDYCLNEPRAPAARITSRMIVASSSGCFRYCPQDKPN